MGRKRRVLTPERSAVHRWGSELRARRDQCGLSLAGLGRLALYDASYLGRLERGDQFATLAVAEACDRVLGAGGELVRFWHAADRERRHADGPGAGAVGQAASGGRPVDDADLQLVTVMPLHAVTAMYGEQGCGPGSPLTTESIARLIASIVWPFDSLALRLFNQNPGSRRRVLPGIHGDVLMINRRTCFPDHVAHVAHDQRPDIWVDVIGEDKQQVVVAVWPGEPGSPRAEQDDPCLRAQCLSALAHPGQELLIGVA